MSLFEIGLWDDISDSEKIVCLDAIKFVTTVLEKVRSGGYNAIEDEILDYPPFFRESMLLAKDGVSQDVLQMFLSNAAGSIKKGQIGSMEKLVYIQGALLIYNGVGIKTAELVLLGLLGMDMYNYGQDYFYRLEQREMEKRSQSIKPVSGADDYHGHMLSGAMSYLSGYIFDKVDLTDFAMFLMGANENIRQEMIGGLSRNKRDLLINEISRVRDKGEFSPERSKEAGGRIKEIMDNYF